MGSDGKDGHVSCVFDLETKPDKFAKVLARRRRLKASSPLHEISTASAMDLTFDGAGHLTCMTLRTWHEDEMPEKDIIASVLKQINAAVVSGGHVVTFNGRRFDIPLIRMRQLRWWLGNHALLEGMIRRSSPHFDVMAEFSYGLPQPPSLAEACAMIGFALQGPDRLSDERDLPYQYEKCETDVLGTAILYLYMMADRSGTPSILSSNLQCLGAELRGLGGVSPHLARFAVSPLLAENASPWGA